MRQPFTDEEEKIIIDLWETHSISYISKLINRSYNSVRDHAIRIKLRDKRIVWTPEQLDVFVSIFPYHIAKVIQKMMKPIRPSITVVEIRNKGSHLGLQKKYTRETYIKETRMIKNETLQKNLMLMKYGIIDYLPEKRHWGKINKKMRSLRFYMVRKYKYHIIKRDPAVYYDDNTIRMLNLENSYKICNQNAHVKYLNEIHK